MHTATYYIDLLLSGITVGSLYALIAIGYTMVYGILRLINFAHGDIFMMAGFFMVYISASMPMAVAIPVVLIMTVALGLLIERAAYKPLRSAPRMSVMISAIGVSYLLQNLATYITGGLARPYPEIPFLKGTFMLGTLKIKIITVVTPLLTILLVIALVLFINHTKTGTEDRHNCHFLSFELFYGCFADRGFNFNVCERQLSGCLVAHQHCNLADHLAELLGACVFLSDNTDFVLDQRVIHDDCSCHFPFSFVLFKIYSFSPSCSIK